MSLLQLERRSSWIIMLAGIKFLLFCRTVMLSLYYPNSWAKNLICPSDTFIIIFSPPADCSDRKGTCFFQVSFHYGFYVLPAAMQMPNYSPFSLWLIANHDINHKNGSLSLCSERNGEWRKLTQWSPEIKNVWHIQFNHCVLVHQSITRCTLWPAQVNVMSRLH